MKKLETLDTVYIVSYIYNNKFVFVYGKIYNNSILIKQIES